MAGELDNEQKGQPLATGTGNSTLNSYVEIQLELLTINVFFDGTGNNMYNTKARLETTHTKLTRQTSYENYYTNVALLYMAARNTDSMQNIYIEGAGTRKHKEDNTKFGMGTATDSTGAYARVAEAFREINTFVSVLEPIRIQLNVFGFSRGSFYARFFCAMAKEKPKPALGMHGENTSEYSKQAKDAGRGELEFPASKTNINFVGIFETVSSHGARHYNDLETFPLDIGQKQGIRRIVHLTAQNEYRKHFPLTRVNTAVANKIAFECSFPGAHSDLGGGYIDGWEEGREGGHYLSVLGTTGNLHEELVKEKGELPWQWYKEMGYYQGTPLNKAGQYDNFEVKEKTYHDSDWGYGETARTIQAVYAHRKFKSNAYQFIPLEIMRDIAKKEAHISFDGEEQVRLEDSIQSVSNEGGVLKKFRNYAHDYTMENYRLNGLSFKANADTVLTAAERQALYHQYIHNSLDAKDGLANGSDGRNKDGSGNPQRIIISDN